MAIPDFNVIVIGLGGMGSAVCYHLARRGQRVLGLEQFDIPHELGSSHGSSRVIRLAYYEDPRYVPLVRRAYQLWHELEVACNERLMVLTGGVDLGHPESAEITGVRASLQQHGISFESLDAAALRRRFTMLSPPDSHVGIYQSETGLLIPERCTIAHVEGAMRHGAECHARERVTDWRASGGRVTVTTDRATYTAGRLVITAGAWLPQLLSELQPRIRVERQVMAWFRPRRPELFEVGQMPIFIQHLDVNAMTALSKGQPQAEGAAYYGVPHHGRPGVKICRHHGGATVDPNQLDRTPTAADETDLRAFVSSYVPLADGPLMGMKVCLYTNTPNYHFIVDRHPWHAEVLVAGGFSGHGYKFASVIGEIMAEFCIDGRTRHSIGHFAFNR